MAVMGLESQRATTSQPPGTNGDGEKHQALAEEAEKPSQYISKEMIKKTTDALENPLMRVMSDDIEKLQEQIFRIVLVLVCERIQPKDLPLESCYFIRSCSRCVSSASGEMQMRDSGALAKASCCTYYRQRERT